jgi:hypothetical protein
VGVWGVGHTGVCALASCKVRGVDEDATDAQNFLAYPGSGDRGSVYVYDTVNLVRLRSLSPACLVCTGAANVVSFRSG